MLNVTTILNYRANQPQAASVPAMKKIICAAIGCLLSLHAFSWGFFAHRKINEYAVFLLPPEMLGWYKLNITWLGDHATDPDKRRYAVPEEGPRHYIDLDHYGHYPFDSLPRNWNKAMEKYGADSLQAHGIVPWWIHTMLNRLTAAFREKDPQKILRCSAELGHYMADAHVPLHTSSNHNGQQTNQHGIHGFWESRVPELLADREWDFLIGKAVYLADPDKFTWARILESAAAADSVLLIEKKLTNEYPSQRKYAFEERNGLLVRQYSAAFTRAYDARLGGMIERRMRAAVFAVASCWYTAWINAGQPDLSQLGKVKQSPAAQSEADSLENNWKNGRIKGREHE